MTGAVEAVATHTILAVELLGEGIHVGIVGHGLVEGGVEHTDLGNLGQQSADSIDTLDIGGIVQRSEVVASLKGLHHLGSEQHALVELLTTMYHTVTYSIQFVEVLQHGVLTLSEHLEDPLYTGSVLGDWALHLVLLTIELDIDKTIGQTDLLDTTTGDDALVIHVIKGILD